MSESGQLHPPQKKNNKKRTKKTPKNKQTKNTPPPKKKTKKKTHKKKQANKKKQKKKTHTHIHKLSSVKVSTQSDPSIPHQHIHNGALGYPLSAYLAG